MLFFILLLMPTLCKGQTFAIKGNLYPIQYTNAIRSEYEGTNPLKHVESLQDDAIQCAIYMLDSGEWRRYKEHPCKPQDYGQGENIFISDDKQAPGDKYVEVLFAAAIDAWNAEKELIKNIIEKSTIPPYFQLQRGKHGHFIQLVWKSSVYAGCGGAVKEFKFGEKQFYKYLLICRYSPPGNNYDNIASLEANLPTLSELAGIETEPPCVDKFAETTCRALKVKCNSEYMKRNCMATCEVCTKSITTSLGDRMPMFKSLEVTCQDEIDCTNLTGFCKIKDVYEKCQASCKKC